MPIRRTKQEAHIYRQPRSALSLSPLRLGRTNRGVNDADYSRVPPPGGCVRVIYGMQSRFNEILRYICIRIHNKLANKKVFFFIISLPFVHTARRYYRD